ncbi:MAG TPA: BsuPI-related putative proteinase inhibitor [Longimicrobium sp.]|nr:BsuPI-related putative proteinase inhibitor [Longimicrobium sp.]
MPVRRIAVLAAAVLAAACAPAAPPAGTGAPAPRQDAAPAALATSLSVETAGDTVRMTLQVTNATAGPLAVAFPSGQTYDFAVLRGSDTLWQWSANKRWTQALREETLAPGETRTYTEPWVPESPVRGELTARGWLTSSSHPVERTATIRLP